MSNKFILYGAAAIGNIVKESLEKCGYEIVGYIDKRAFELREYNGLPVWEIDTVPKEYRNTEVYIFIAVKNVYEHEKIAILLGKKGYGNIIYKPYSVLLGYGSNKEEEIAAIYDKLFAGNMTGKFILPQIVSEEKLYHDFALICEGQGKVTAYIPTEFIFTNDYQDGGMKKWGNINILAFFTHINFFRFLNNDHSANVFNYLEEYCVYTAELTGKIRITDAWKDNVIENRTHIYEQMKEAMDLDPDFFIRNAAEAKWNEQKGYFNLTSGKHRCAFQAAMGKRYIPLRINRADYEAFYNHTEVEKVFACMKEYSRELYIPHPLFYRGMLVRDRGESNFSAWFAKYYAEKTYFRNKKVTFDDLKIYDYTDDLGNFARFCSRMGCKVYREEQSMLEKQINSLLHSHNIKYQVVAQTVENSLIIVDTKCVEEKQNIFEKYFKTKGNTWIVKYVSSTAIADFSKSMGLRIVSEVNMKYEQGKIVKTYLLEGI